VLARDLGINRSTVTSRSDRLVDSGVIEGFTIRLSSDVDRDAMCGGTTVVSEPDHGQDVVREIRGYPEGEQLHSTTAAWDLSCSRAVATCPSSTSSWHAFEPSPASATPTPACSSAPRRPRDASPLGPEWSMAVQLA